jgi:hypothetical protein
MDQATTLAVAAIGHLFQRLKEHFAAQRNARGRADDAATALARFRSNRHLAKRGQRLALHS